MDNYSSFSVTTRGYSHIVKGTPCEDSSLHYSAEKMHIAAIADGHGDKKCFRSAIGSSCAVEIAKTDLQTFAESIEKTECNPNTENWGERLFQKGTADAIGQQLARSIITKWLNQVHEHYNDNPITDEELNNAGIQDSLFNTEHSIQHIYGTTLIAALLTEKYLIVVHQGDGRCVIVHQNGLIDQPVPWDPRCEGRETTSLCDSDAVNSCRYYINNQVENPIIACFVASDGVEDSFENQDEVNAYFGYLTAKYVELGSDGLTEYLQSMLPDFSKHGSRDDISIAGIVNIDAAMPYVERFNLASELRTHESVARRARNKLDSMYRKMEFLSGEFERAKKCYEDAVTSSESAARDVEGIVEKLRIANLFKKTSADECEKAKAKYLAIKAEYDEYKERHSEYVQKLEEANERIEKTKEQLARLEIDVLIKENVPTVPVEELIRVGVADDTDNTPDEDSQCAEKENPCEDEAEPDSLPNSCNADKSDMEK